MSKAIDNIIKALTEQLFKDDGQDTCLTIDYWKYATGDKRIFVSLWKSNVGAKGVFLIDETIDIK